MATIVITLGSFGLRIWHLGTPHEFEFDETYYAKDAWSLLHHGYAVNWDATANTQILAGHLSGIAQSTPEMIVHPEVGKWLIALGEAMFGFTPFGWRFSSVVVGSLLIMVMMRLIQRVTKSLILSIAGGLLLSFDGLEFVLSRLGLLDIYLAFFTVCAVLALVCERDRLVRDEQYRYRLFRPWLLVSGICWGLACGTKWDAMYPLAAFSLLYVAWCASARIRSGMQTPRLRALVVDGATAFVHLVVVAAIVYVTSWTGWLINHNVYEQNLSSTQYTQYTGSGHCEGETYVADNPDTNARWPTAVEGPRHGVAGFVQALESLAHYHRDVYVFHTHFLNCATHTYASQPSGWLLLNRPVGASADNGIKPGDQGCTAAANDTCLRQVLLLGTPVLWWGGALALLAALILWIGQRDWRFGIAVGGAEST